MTKSKKNISSNCRINRLQCYIDGRNFFNQLVKIDLRTNDNIRKIAISQHDDSTTGCLIDHIYFKNYYKPITIGLSKQQKIRC